MTKTVEKTISPNQRAFVKRSSIAENSVLAHEVVHKVQHNKGKKGLMILKLDMIKAYNRIKWQFIDKTLKA